MRSLIAFFDRIHHTLHGHIILCLLVTNGMGALWPQWGHELRAVSFGTLSMGSASMDMGLSTVLLSLLLLNAGLGVSWNNLRCLREKPQLLFWGLLVRALFPLAAALMLAVYHRSGTSQHGVGSLIVALTFIAALPVAGAAPAWAQNVSGNLGLALGITVVSTLLSPFTIPLGIDLAAHLTTGTFASELQHLLSGGTELFLVMAVALPCGVAVVARSLAGEARIKRTMPVLKVANLAALLTLNYINAASALPQALAQPEWSFLIFTTACISVVCLWSFAAGPWLARRLRSRHEDGIALLFCMGMCNNGAGLVLVASAFQNHPHALQTLVLYGVIQQLGAGLATRWCAKAEARRDEAGPLFAVERRSAA